MKKEISNSEQTPPFSKNDVICCGILERMNISWMEFNDGTKCIPHIKGLSDGNLYRVNYCPSCGKQVREVIIQP